MSWREPGRAFIGEFRIMPRIYSPTIVYREPNETQDYPGSRVAPKDFKFVIAFT